MFYNSKLIVMFNPSRIKSCRFKLYNEIKKLIPYQICSLIRSRLKLNKYANFWGGESGGRAYKLVQTAQPGQNIYLKMHLEVVCVLLETCKKIKNVNFFYADLSLKFLRPQIVLSRSFWALQCVQYIHTLTSFPRIKQI